MIYNPKTGKVMELAVKQSIDKYLDVYNDYKILYEKFGDKEYHNAMMWCINKLRVLSKG